ncbi:MAG: sugar ABC transporter ATP-binding protein [Gallicola sp.]|nr:sugar ABC transporter ATP-binding protein [Gallicola sp.]
MNETILEMEHINKTFGPVKALKDVHMDLKSGEVHALMGENGAGKSTLMKILSGVYDLETGTLTYFGKETVFTNPKEAQEAGIAIVHQELNMMADLTVAENIYIGRETMSGVLINDGDMIRKSRELFNELGVEVDPGATVKDIPVGMQQMTEIAKAISMDAKIIIFDEPTTSLTDEEIVQLFKIIRELQAKGIGIIYISHRMDEIGVITDRITVMRDGEYVGTVHTKDTTKDELINMMVGRVTYVEPKASSTVAEDAEVVLQAKNLNRGIHVKDVSFSLKKGEILGFAGLMGAGRTEVARLIFGADKLDSGEIFVNGKEVKIHTTADAVNNGIGYLSEDRRSDGMITDFDVADNISMCTIPEFVEGALINDRKIEEVAGKYVEDLKIKCSSVNQVAKTLSGGNQQKVVIAKWLHAKSDILIFDEPTKGIDVGAKNEIYKLMNALVAEGKSIIMISSEMEEILRLSDRVIVMSEGRKTADLMIQEADQETIMKFASQEGVA